MANPMIRAYVRTLFVEYLQDRLRQLLAERINLRPDIVNRVVEI
jgi:hypothetical protein